MANQYTDAWEDVEDIELINIYHTTILRWSEIGKVMGRSKSSVYERGKRLNLCGEPRDPEKVVATSPFRPKRMKAEVARRSDIRRSLHTDDEFIEKWADRKARLARERQQQQQMSAGASQPPSSGSPVTARSVHA